MSQLVNTKKIQAKPVDNAQKTFIRLKRKIDTLKEELEATNIYLNDVLLHYHTTILPAKKDSRKALESSVKMLYEHYKNPQNRSKKKQNLLKEIIVHKISQFFESSLLSEFDPEVINIYKELENVSHDELASEISNEMREELEQRFKKDGIDIDLSQVNFAGSEEEIKSKIFEALHEAKENERQEQEYSPRQKSKQTLAKEKKAQELENIQKKSLSTIYKQLAKTLHPDLEQDQEIKLQKEVLMKKLTAAYEDNDLHTILSLEIEWLNQNEDAVKQSSSDHIKMYNTLLKDQVAALQEDIENIIMSPKYAAIQPFFESNVFPPEVMMELTLEQIQAHTKQSHAITKELKGKKAESILTDMIDSFEDYKNSL